MSIAGGAAIQRQTGPKEWSNGLAENDVGQANLLSCASVAVSKKVQGDDTKCVWGE